MLLEPINFDDIDVSNPHLKKNKMKWFFFILKLFKLILKYRLHSVVIYHCL